MKKKLFLFVTLLSLFWNGSSFALGELGEGGGVNSNPHNLSYQSLNVNKSNDSDETQICIFCHIPHGAVVQTPLWGRPDPDGPIGGFVPYTNAALGIADASVVANSLYGVDYPNGASKLCLSCHDGVTAMGILSNGYDITMTGTGVLTGSAVIDVSTSHPISFVYDSTVLPLLTGLGKSLKLPVTGYLDSSSRVQCTSCHQPHQDTMASNGLPFWHVDTGNNSNDYNTVCNACHTAPPSPGTGHGY